MLPAPIEVFFLLAKPQLGGTVALYWLKIAWIEGGRREVARIDFPVTMTFLISLAIFGLWPVYSIQSTSFGWNTSLWPYSIPIGKFIFYLAYHRHNKILAMGANPFLSPYLALHSWSSLLLSMIPSNILTILTVFGM